jgi:ParB family transcriptional regulator, chromosome partitioning protein
MTRHAGLGRGLSALIPAGGELGDAYREIPLDRISPNPRQPRSSFDEAGLHELAQSVRELGVLQPVLVRAIEDERFELIAGERRYRAAGIAGLDAIPAIIRQTDDAELLTEALVENIHRTDLNPLEEAAAYRQLLDDLGMTHDELATRIGRSRSAISNALRLLGLPPILQHKVAVGSLTAGHARALLSLEDADQQQRVAQRVIGEGMSVRATEELVRQLTEGGDRLDELAAAARRRADSPYAHLQSRLTDALATRVRITGSDRRGSVVINYSGREDLERVLRILGSGAGQNFLRED